MLDPEGGDSGRIRLPRQDARVVGGCADRQGAAIGRVAGHEPGGLPETALLGHGVRLEPDGGRGPDVHAGDLDRRCVEPAEAAQRTGGQMGDDRQRGFALAGNGRSTPDVLDGGERKLLGGAEAQHGALAPAALREMALALLEIGGEQAGVLLGVQPAVLLSAGILDGGGEGPDFEARVVCERGAVKPAGHQAVVFVPLHLDRPFAGGAELREGRPQDRRRAMLLEQPHGGVDELDGGEVAGDVGQEAGLLGGGPGPVEVRFQEVARIDAANHGQAAAGRKCEREHVEAQLARKLCDARGRVPPDHASAVLAGRERGRHADVDPHELGARLAEHEGSAAARSVPGDQHVGDERGRGGAAGAVGVPTAEAVDARVVHAVDGQRGLRKRLGRADQVGQLDGQRAGGRAGGAQTHLESDGLVQRGVQAQLAARRGVDFVFEGGRSVVREVLILCGGPDGERAGCRSEAAGPEDEAGRSEGGERPTAVLDARRAHERGSGQPCAS